mmetsp:Transcript_37470/g.38156  ORF Transcript_37470/g.38156 Transcript_37470/m.38156 type:complete len:177 (-) Transcript_37470:480-1010(-)
MDDDFETALAETNKHYDSRRSVAHAFLCTMGAKALTVTELQLVSAEKTLYDLQDEARARNELQRNEASLSLMNQLSSNEGVTATKRDRRGRTRLIQMRYANFPCGNSFSWKSTQGWRMRQFSFVTLDAVEEILVTENRTKRKYIRIVNAKRRLELRFENSLLQTACLAFLKWQLNK